MSEYHVTCGVEKKVVRVEDRNTLLDVIRQEFTVDSSSPLLLQSWSTKYNDWVNVNDVTLLPDRCKLLVIVTGARFKTRKPS